MSSLPFEGPPPIIPDRHALFLDLDGTLAPICEKPDQVVLQSDLITILGRLNIALGGRMGIISGRSVKDLKNLLTGLPFRLAGVHGSERTDEQGMVQRGTAPPGFDDARRMLAVYAKTVPGLLLEDKGLALALHYRQAPGAEAEAKAIVQSVARQLGLAVQPGKMVIELKAERTDKGVAIRSFMQERTFSGFTPIFVGDDATDEAGFAACAELGGYGIVVGDAVDTAARFRLADVQAVQDWLKSGLKETAR